MTDGQHRAVLRLQRATTVNERRVEGFFYGLFMDSAVLRNSGVVAVDARQAYVDDFALRIGNRATLIQSHGSRVFGMLIALTHRQLDKLYGAPGLEQYRPEAVVARCLDGNSVPALCYNLISEPRPDERNPQYAARLQRTSQRS